MVLIFVGANVYYVLRDKAVAMSCAMEAVHWSGSAAAGPYSVLPFGGFLANLVSTFAGFGHHSSLWPSSHNI